MQFYPADWRKDPQLRMCGMITQGIWINLICLMWEAEIEGQITGTLEELCRAIGCQPEELNEFLDDIKKHKFGDVTNCNGDFTITCRRLKKIVREREGVKERVAKHRQKRNVTKSNVVSSSSTSSSVTSSYIYKEIVGYWNSKKNLPKVNAITSTRKRQLNIRLKEEPFNTNWKNIIDKLSLSEFHTGKNERGWRANIDWLLKNDTNYIKILELQIATEQKTEKKGKSFQERYNKKIAELQAAGKFKPGMKIEV